MTVSVFPCRQNSRSCWLVKDPNTPTHLKVLRAGSSVTEASSCHVLAGTTPVGLWPTNLAVLADTGMLGIVAGGMTCSSHGSCMIGHCDRIPPTLRSPDPVDHAQIDTSSACFFW